MLGFFLTRPLIFGSHFSINIRFIKNTIGITNLFVLFILDIYVYTTSAITGVISMGESGRSWVRTPARHDKKYTVFC